MFPKHIWSQKAFVPNNKPFGHSHQHKQRKWRKEKMLTVCCPPPILVIPVGRGDTPWTGPLKLFKVFIFRQGNADSQLAYMLVYHTSVWADFCPFLPRLFAFLCWPAWHHAKTDVLVWYLAELQYVETAVLHLCHLTIALLKGLFSCSDYESQTHASANFSLCRQSKYVSWHLRGQLEKWRPCNFKCFLFPFVLAALKCLGWNRMCPAYKTVCPIPKHHSQLQNARLLSAASLPNVADPQRCVCWSCSFSGGSPLTFSQFLCETCRLLH